MKTEKQVQKLLLNQRIEIERAIRKRLSRIPTMQWGGIHTVVDLDDVLGAFFNETPEKLR